MEARGTISFLQLVAMNIKILTRNCRGCWRLLGGKKTDITLKPNKNTFQTIMIITDNVLVDLRTPNSIRTVLGFDAALIGTSLMKTGEPGRALAHLLQRDML